MKKINTFNIEKNQDCADNDNCHFMFKQVYELYRTLNQIIENQNEIIEIIGDLSPEELRRKLEDQYSRI